MKNSRSIVFKRQQILLKALKENVNIDVNQMATDLNVSPTTIRRDLKTFEKQKLVNRFHGGAHIISSILKEDPEPEEATPSNLSQKQAIARCATQFIQEGDTIFINSSSTALMLLDYLHEKRVTIITNNGNAIGHPKDPLVELVLTGGEVYDRKKSMIGEFALHTVSKIMVDKSFIGVSGISTRNGITTSVLQETMVNDLMMRNCQGSCYVLATASKIGKQHNFLSGTIDKVSVVITGTGADPDELNNLRKKGIKIIEV